MKKKNYLLRVFCLIMLACTACDEEQDNLHPVLPGDTVETFFEEYLPACSGTASVPFFVDAEDKCLMINSTDELRKIILSSIVEIPAIDFNSHTLVLGQRAMPGTSYCVLEHNIHVESEKYILNLSIEEPEGTYTVICPVYYWGLYPKLPQRTIEVNVLYKK